MGVTATNVEIATGLAMPFIPMRPRIGRPIRTSREIKSAVDVLDDDKTLVRPALCGTRACLAVVDRNIFIQDDSGKWITKPPRNGRDFLKLPNNTCLDGYIAYGDFYSADCVALRGQSLLRNPASERETVAFQLCKFLEHPWLFQQPSPKFIRARRQNLPRFPGLTLKDYMSFYTLLSSQTETSESLLKRLW